MQMTSHPLTIMSQKKSFMKHQNGGVIETKEHDSGFKQSFVGDESCLLLMPILDADIVISPSDIKLDEVFCILEFIDKVRDKRKRVSISDDMFI